MGSSLSLLVSGAFCHLFSQAQLQAFVRHAGFGVDDFPALCLAFARYSPLLIVAAPLLFGYGLLRIARDPSPSLVAETLTQGLLVLALLLVLACILAWQIPYATIPASGQIA